MEPLSENFWVNGEVQVKFECPVCQTPQKIPTTVMRVMRNAGIFVGCSNCNHPFSRKELFQQQRKLRGRTDDQKRSIEQEKNAAKRYGGKRVPASGAMPGSKGDVRDKGRLMVECKFTRAKSYRLKLEDLMKLESEAGANEAPVFEIEFHSVHPHRRYVVIPDWYYEHLEGLKP